MILDNGIRDDVLNQILRATAAPAVTGPFVISLHTASPMKTINEAGLTSEDVHARAESPAVHPVKEP